MGFKQFVKEPTRGKYILDLVLTDVTDSAASTLATVAHHRYVLTKLQFKVPETSTYQREIWHFKDADLVKLATNIEDTNWDFRSSYAPSQKTRPMTEKLLHIVDYNIPKPWLCIRKTTHPWLTQQKANAVKRKHKIQGSDRKAKAARQCNEISINGHHDSARKTITEVTESKACIQTVVIQSQKADKPEAASIKHSCFERWIDLAPNCSGKCKLFRKLRRHHKCNARKTSQFILKNWKRACSILLLHVKRWSNRQGIAQSTRRQRLWTKLGANKKIKTLFERVYANTAQINSNKCGFKQITYALNNKLCKLLCKFKSNYNTINHINIHFSQIIKLMKKQKKTCLVVPQLLSKKYFAEVNCLAYPKNNA